MHIPTNKSQIVKQWVGDNQRIEIKWTIILSRFLIKKNSSSLLIALYIVYSPIVCWSIRLASSHFPVDEHKFR